MRPKLVCFDGNLEVDAMVDVLQHCEREGIPSASFLSTPLALAHPTLFCSLL